MGPYLKIGRRILGSAKTLKPVGDGADHLLPGELGPPGGALGGTGRATSHLGSDLENSHSPR
jgi:hypothetical protein